MQGTISNLFPGLGFVPRVRVAADFSSVIPFFGTALFPENN